MCGVKLVLFILIWNKEYYWFYNLSVKKHPAIKRFFVTLCSVKTCIFNCCCHGCCPTCLTPLSLSSHADADRRRLPRVGYRPTTCGGRWAPRRERSWRVGWLTAPSDHSSPRWQPGIYRYRKGDQEGDRLDNSHGCGSKYIEFGSKIFGQFWIWIQFYLCYHFWKKIFF